MEKKPYSKLTAIVFAILAVLFSAFSIYTMAFNDNEITALRQQRSYQTLTDISVQQIESPAAPLGVEQQYTIPLDSIELGDTCLIFYTVHQLVQVKMDDDTIYTLDAGSNSMGKSPSSNWVIIPIYPSDSGRQLSVTITPVYQSVLHRQVSFIIGSKYAFFTDRFQKDLPQLMLSGLCILMGLVLIVVHLKMLSDKKTFTWDNVYLGFFSLFLGIWRLTDTRFSSILFADSAKALGYVTILALFIMPIPLLLFFCELCSGKRRVLINCTALITSGITLTAFLLQILRIVDLRQILLVSHIMLGVDIAIMLFVIFLFPPETQKDRTLRLFTILITSSCILDLLLFYFMGNSSGLYITLIMFLFCACYKFIINMVEMTKKAYYDKNTRLFNKTRWQEVLEKEVSDDETIGMIMFDLNSLKQVNDSLGHEVGDHLIAAFADVLRCIVSSSDLLCRWGGDEFTILIRKATRQKITDYIFEIRKSVDRFNLTARDFQIHFACGYAISSDYPELSRHELLSKADEMMYMDKKRWHETHSLPYSMEMTQHSKERNR